MHLGRSPAPGRVRVTGGVAYDDKLSEEYWFDFPEHTAPQLSTAGTPWLACLLPLAVARREPLRIALPVDPVLLRGARELMRVWRSWYPDVVEIDVEASGCSMADVERGVRDAAFFSGGVDSFFTILRHLESSTGSAGAREGTRIDDIITVIGFDVPLSARAAAERLRSRYGALAVDLGLDFIDVETNLRATRWIEASWEYLAHGPALAAVALFLEPRFRRVHIAATGGYRDLHAWASHPLTDPLLSTSRTAIVHDGAAWSRTDKTRLLVDNEHAMRNLRVCWRSESDRNCGRCNKCYRTMLILELLGSLRSCETFRDAALDMADAARVHCARPWDFREFEDIRALAVRSARPDIARAAELTMRRSRALNRRLERLHVMRGRGLPHRIADMAERQMLRKWIV